MENQVNREGGRHSNDGQINDKRKDRREILSGEPSLTTSQLEEMNLSAFLSNNTLQLYLYQQGNAIHETTQGRRTVKITSYKQLDWEERFSHKQPCEVKPYHVHERS